LSFVTPKGTHVARLHLFQIPYRRQMGCWKCECPACIRKVPQTARYTTSCLKKRPTFGLL